MPTKNSAASRRAAVLLTAATAITLPSLLTAPVAWAADRPGGDHATTTPKPPARMSTVGGERLGLPGTQVALKPGAPKLPKGLSGRAWMVSDAESGDVLAAHNAHWRLPPASTLKMLFADTVLPKLPKERTHTVAPSDLAGIGANSSLVGVKEHETYSVHDLWLGVFLKSGNDAVHVLSAMNHGVPKTVRDMQRHAETLNAKDTHVVSPDGYDAKGQVSSAYDLTLFARSGLQKPDFRSYCSTATTTFPGATKKITKGEHKGEKKRGGFEIQNTNRLLTGDTGLRPYRGIAGVKNGYTTNAGNTFTGVAQRGDRKLLVTVMNPEKSDRNEVYRETARLFDWGFAAADKTEPVGTLVAPQNAQSGGNTDEDTRSGEKGAAGAPGDGSDASGHASTSAATDHGSSGLWTAVGISGASVAVLAAGSWLVHRRWPLPDLVRRRRD